MTDVRTIWIPALARGDWRMAGPSLESGHDLESAVLISIFSDGLALADDEIPDGTTDRRGWWGDTDQPDLPDGSADDVPIGSKLWLLDREIADAATLIKARDAIRDSLQWLIDDAVASTITVFTEYEARGFMGCLLTINRRGGLPVSMRFAWAWGV